MQKAYKRTKTWVEFRQRLLDTISYVELMNDQMEDRNCESNSNEPGKSQSKSECIPDVSSTKIFQQDFDRYDGFDETDHNMELFQWYPNFDEDADIKNKDERDIVTKIEVEKKGEKSMIENFEDEKSNNVKIENKIKINLAESNEIFHTNDKEGETLPEPNNLATSKTTITDIDQGSEMNDPGYYCENGINMNKCDLTGTIVTYCDEDDLPVIGIERDNNPFISYQRLVVMRAVAANSLDCCYQNKVSDKVLADERNMTYNMMDNVECCCRNGIVQVDEKEVLEEKSNHIEGGETSVGLKVEKGNKLVFDRGKFIKSSKAISDKHYDEINTESMLMRPGNEYNMTGHDEEIDLIKRANRVNNSVIILRHNERIKINLSETDDADEASIIGHSYIYGIEVEKCEDNAFDCYQKLIMLIGNCEKGGGNEKLIDEIGENNQNNALTSEKIFDYYNNSVETRKTNINKHDIPIFRVENINNGDKAPDGRAENVSIELRNIEGIRDKDIKNNYLHEYEFPDKVSCRSKCLDRNDESVMATEEDKEAMMNVWNIINKLQYVRKKSKEI
ncbi:hypothetical protein F8M41_025444 [Gigaspora margarita]|uniref:Uncharacterized protein n=1 Tax=Gigaspora margarita TaxID=4874 RepID=A0A8H3XMB0_GIGMA|nr:hypothetical protein F8M41_025444 [Gigaspora margarita]